MNFITFHFLMKKLQDDIANTDLVIWDNFKNGSESAFKRIYTDHYEALFNYGVKIINHEDLVKDCIQELFVELWSKKGTIGHTNSIRFYLLKSIKRKIIYKHNKNQSIHARILGMEYDFQLTYSIEDKIIEEQNAETKKREVAALLNQLSKRQKEAIYLKFYNQLDYEQIASVMEINIQSVRTLIHEALKRMKEISQK